MKKKFKREDLIILILALVLLFFSIFIENNKKMVEDHHYDEKYRAAEIMEKSLDGIKREKIARGIEIDPSIDINETGIIGEEFNGITTTLGALESKRTSANPNFAAVMVDLLLEAGLGRGDNIAVNFSSSFPALNIASLAACEVLEVNPIIITSIGSSTWGGNNLDFTYLDMEEFLYQEELIHARSRAFSPGGAGDLGGDMDPEELEKIIARIEETGRRLILEEDLESNIDLRYALYHEEVDGIDGFINIGGNILSFGNTQDSTSTPAGLIKNQDYKIDDKSGLVQRFVSEGVPTIHLLNIKELAYDYGLKVDPNTPFVLGEGDIYYAYEYPYKWIGLVLVLALSGLVIFNRKTKVAYD